MKAIAVGNGISEAERMGNYPRYRFGWWVVVRKEPVDRKGEGEMIIRIKSLLRRDPGHRDQ